MSKFYKIVSACLVAVFLISCLSLVSMAEQDPTDPTDTVITQEPSIEPSTEEQPTGSTNEGEIPTESDTSDPSESSTDESEEFSTEEPTAESTDVIYSVNMSTTEKEDEENDAPQYTQRRTTTRKYDSLTKTTKAIKTTKPTTVKKNITDYGKVTMRYIWIPIVLMILSAGGLIAINVLNYQKKHSKK